MDTGEESPVGFGMSRQAGVGAKYGLLCDNTPSFSFLMMLLLLSQVHKSEESDPHGRRNRKVTTTRLFLFLIVRCEIVPSMGLPM